MNNKKKRHNLSNNPSKIYLVTTMIFLLSFGFFLTSKLYITETDDVLQTAIGKEFELYGSKKITINDWAYDEEKNKMQIILITNNLSSYLTELNFYAISKLDTSKKLDTKVEYESNDIYIISINNIPKNFNQISLKIEENSIGSKTDDTKKQVASFYTDERVVERASLNEEELNSFAIKATDEMINEANKSITNSKKTVEDKQNQIKNIELQIAKLKQDLTFQTLEEQTETNNEIFGLKNQIISFENEIKELEIEQAAYNEKINKLKQRKKELNL